MIDPQALVAQVVVEYQLKYGITEKQAHIEIRRELRHILTK